MRKPLVCFFARWWRIPCCSRRSAWLREARREATVSACFNTAGRFAAHAAIHRRETTSDVARAGTTDGDVRALEQYRNLVKGMGERDRINHVHYRNVVVRKPYVDYTEAFLDEWRGNIFAVMRDARGMYRGAGGRVGEVYNVAYAKAMPQAAMSV